MKLRLPNRSFALFGAILIGSAVPSSAQTCNDTFDDGTIDQSRWEVGGARRGYSGYGAGNWQWSFAEVPAVDGYLQLRVFGPMSANSYGGEAWVRTRCNYNDGNEHVINLRWGSSINASHVDAFAVEVSNGEVDTSTGNVGWFFADSAGNKNLYLTASHLALSAPCANENGMGNVAQTTWSIQIDGATHTATLYDGPNLSGSATCQKTLDPSQPWYVRFIIMDVTSMGFPAGDNSFFLYDYSETVVVVTPCSLVQGLIDVVNSADVGVQNKRPLIATLEASCAAFERSNWNAAVNQLQAFQNQVRAQLQPKFPELAETLLRDSQAIIVSAAGTH